MVDDRRPWAADLAHPVPLAAVAALVLNDHVLKHAAWAPRLLSGKLSDAAGLFFFPILLLTLASVGGSARRALPAVASAVATGTAFAAVKLSPPVNAWVSHAWGPIALDPTDLATLPALALSVMWMTRRQLAGATPAPRWLRAAAVLFTAAASLATTQARQVRLYPMWTVVDGGDARFACADLHTWVVKSGKEGAGVMVRITGRGAGSVAIEDARFEVGPASHPAVTRAPGFAMVPGVASDAYVGFAFDGEDAWQRGTRDGLVVMRVAACGEETELRVRVAYRVDRRQLVSPPSPPSSTALLVAAPEVAAPDAGAPPAEPP